MIKIFGVFILLLNCQINKNPSLKLIYSLASTTNASAVTLTSLIPDSAALSPSFSERIRLQLRALAVPTMIYPLWRLVQAHLVPHLQRQLLLIPHLLRIQLRLLL